MTLQNLVQIFGDGHFKLCEGKRAIDSNLYDLIAAEHWIAGGGTIGLWCPEGFVIVDIDDQVQAEIMNHLTNTLKCRTPHGMHFYFRTDKPIRQSVKAHTAIGLRIDTRVADKGYCILPYGCSDREWIEGAVEELPEWIAPLSISAKATSFIQVGAKSGDGRNDSLIRQVMRLRKEGLSEQAIQETVTIINQCIWDEPLPNGELAGILRNAEGYTPFSTPEDRLDFCLYNDRGSCCGINHKALVDHLVTSYPMFTLGGIIYFYKNGVFSPNPLEVKALIKDLIGVPRYQRQGQINEIFNMLMDDLRIAITDSMCNSQKNVLNFKNGMFDVSSQTLLPHDPAYLSTIQIPHNYEPNELSIRDIQLMDFLEQTKLKQDDINMLLDYMAYSMTVNNGMKCFMTLVGGSNTGKSTLIKMVTALIGKHNMSALSIQDMAVRFYPAQLKDKLVNACADNSSEALNDIANIKKITGDDEIMYEDKGCKPYFFTPFSKLWFSFNTLPLQLEEKSDAFYERIRILEMNNKITLTQTYVDDLCSPESISAIIPILCKRLKGLKRIKPSKNSQRLSNKLRSESDSIHSYMTTQIDVTGDYNDYIARDSLYEGYSRHCMREDKVPHKRAVFYRQLEVLGFIPVRNGNQQVYVGIALRP
jgi:P4 family phage/plasmid primase-like protien